jgi:hypothetical protein
VDIEQKINQILQPHQRNVVVRVGCLQAIILTRVYDFLKDKPQNVLDTS